ncbi:MAG TPA: helicase C-terminal domain-containing protein [Desulfosarcina sp.]|nr:helicase C-terminal domain-containing protein [Desulfosarcina sp.]
MPSPFPRRHLDVLLADGVSTYYTQRERSVDAIRELIEAFVRFKKGNYICFFPSYAYLRMVADRFEEQAAGLKTIVQTPDMDDAGRIRFLEQFASDNRTSLVGFAVMGGVFGEGIDLVGERLSGAVIVGVGLPAICPERELIRGYFDGDGSGFDFAYRYPGINRVLQAAGRVIRTDRDRGVVLLVDRRFATSAYQGLLPRHWPTAVVASHRDLEGHLRRFWHAEA